VWRSRPVAFAIIIAMVAFVGICLRPSSIDQRQRVESPDAVLRRLIEADAERVAAGDSSHAELVRFYQNRHLKPAWLRGGKPSPRARTLIQTFFEATWHGLNPEDYGATVLDSALNRLATVRDIDEDRGWIAASLDRRLTNAFFHYASDRLAGRFNPEKVISTWHGAQRRHRYMGDLLESGLRNGRFEEELSELDPLDPDYEKLTDALATYKAIAETGGWATVPDGPVLIVGQTSPRIIPLRKRLLASGDLHGRGNAKPDTTSQVFSADLLTAVRRFQTRHGLRADGRVGAPELAALNIPVEDRIARLEINMERWRWSPADTTGRHVIVNLPEFMVHLYQGDTLVQAIPAVIGQDTTRTPVFDDQITYIVFGPTWRVPQSILRNELLPSLKKDKNYLSKHFMRVFDGTRSTATELRADSIPWRKLDPESLKIWVRQDPGPENPLGKVKFMLPNPWDIYLHDSPVRGPFLRVDRRASHGCVRVEKPFALAMWLLQDKRATWDSLRIATAMDSSADRVVGLPKAFPVRFEYRTAWVDTLERVHFRSDVYGYDTLHARTVGIPFRTKPSAAKLTASK
jgi:murein L,D-transpeptidase YcbB/YkuD